MNGCEVLVLCHMIFSPFPSFFFFSFVLAHVSYFFSPLKIFGNGHEMIEFFIPSGPDFFFGIKLKKNHWWLEKTSVCVAFTFYPLAPFDQTIYERSLIPTSLSLTHLWREAPVILKSLQRCFHDGGSSTGTSMTSQSELISLL
eukprot:TRINITY_DN7161_c0_g1_i1.p1 TRINITY_DN7161_c0_g1~~TRINITY_DN7161_c0_g1_i1.p1  ORF type:complete len:143 (-),score=18.11 TRINITY_DN7161_c0_g1_i1:193-621(-)